MQSETINPVAAPRIVSVDMLRGLVMVLMALDHVRDFWGPTSYDPLDLSQTSPELYVTRWITHFCAPVFVFLAGTSAFLYRRNTGISMQELSRFLFTRGLWLVFIELTLVTFSWQFGFNFVILQVIWAIGWSMVFLAAFVFLPVPVIAAIGLLMIGGHNLLDGIVPADFGDNAIYWSIAHVGFNYYPNAIGSLDVFVGYPLVPWIGVMAAGYAFGQILQLESGRRDRVLNESEIKQFWTALPACNMTEQMRLALMLLLVTAQRKGEVVKAGRSEFDLNSGWWVIPRERAKNGMPHRVPLSSLAITLVKQALKLAGDSELLFHSDTPDQYIKETALNMAIYRNHDVFAIPHFTPHDLRRTAASLITSMGYSRDIVGKILNHVETGVTAVYDRYSYDNEKKKALDAWARKLQAITEGSQSNVIPLTS